MTILDDESKQLWEELRKCERAQKVFDDLYQAVHESGAENSGIVRIFNFSYDLECYLTKYEHQIGYLSKVHKWVAIYCPSCRKWHEI